ncbi:MAG: GNAT family N-acetyltransferase [Bryobacteraceae bacterium]|nr:GNAT family N-acetyltransferase [Bryobacteraceae bacterium]
MRLTVRNTRESDIQGIIDLCLAVYPDTPPWGEAQIRSHLAVFPEGQFVALDEDSGEVVAMAASLIVWWDDYEADMNWRDFTEHGMFTNHDPDKGRTLYGAEVMVHPGRQGCGIGKALYQARRELVERLGLLRIRAGARLRGYHAHAATLTPEQYTRQVVAGLVPDPTLSFQLKQGFIVLKVVHEYLRHDPESLGYAALIEWINPAVAGAEDYAARDRFALR